MLPALQAAVDATAAAQAALLRQVRLSQRRCRHLNLAECGHRPLWSGGSLPPMRICLSCGMTEDGWGCGHLVLKGKAESISRDELYGLRLGLNITSEHQGPLLRGEVTLNELIDAATEPPKQQRKGP